MPARWDEPLRYRLTGPSGLSRRDNVMPSRIGHFVTESRRLARRDPKTDRQTDARSLISFVIHDAWTY